MLRQYFADAPNIVGFYFTHVNGEFYLLYYYDECGQRVSLENYAAYFYPYRQVPFVVEYIYYHASGLYVPAVFMFNNNVLSPYTGLSMSYVPYNEQFMGYVQAASNDASRLGLVRQDNLMDYNNFLSLYPEFYQMIRAGAAQSDAVVFQSLQKPVPSQMQPEEKKSSKSFKDKKSISTTLEYAQTETKTESVDVETEPVKPEATNTPLQPVKPEATDTPLQPVKPEATNTPLQPEESPVFLVDFNAKDDDFSRLMPDGMIEKSKYEDLNAKYNASIAKLTNATNESLKYKEQSESASALLAELEKEVLELRAVTQELLDVNKGLTATITEYENQSTGKELFISEDEYNDLTEKLATLTRQVSDVKAEKQILEGLLNRVDSCCEKQPVYSGVHNDVQPTSGLSLTAAELFSDIVNNNNLSAQMLQIVQSLAEEGGIYSTSEDVKGLISHFVLTLDERLHNAKRVEQLKRSDIRELQGIINKLNAELMEFRDEYTEMDEMLVQARYKASNLEDELRLLKRKHEQSLAEIQVLNEKNEQLLANAVTQEQSLQGMHTGYQIKTNVATSTGKVTDGVADMGIVIPLEDKLVSDSESGTAYVNDVEAVDSFDGVQDAGERLKRELAEVTSSVNQRLSRHVSSLAIISSPERSDGIKPSYEPIKPAIPDMSNHDSDLKDRANQILSRSSATRELADMGGHDENGVDKEQFEFNTVSDNQQPSEDGRDTSISYNMSDRGIKANNPGLMNLDMLLGEYTEFQKAPSKPVPVKTAQATSGDNLSAQPRPLNLNILEAALSEFV